MPLSNKGWDETASCSTDLRRQSRCRPALTGTRAQARGDPRMASDESDGKAGKSADDVRDEFEEKMDRLRRQYERDLHSFRYEIEEREYRLKAYEDKFNKIKQPPLLYAYVVRKEGPDLDGNQVVVARATELLKVSTGLVDKSQLGVGQYVWVHPQTYAIVEGSAVRNEGVIAKVADMMDGKLVISIEGDMEKRLINTEDRVQEAQAGFPDQRAPSDHGGARGPPEPRGQVPVARRETEREVRPDRRAHGGHRADQGRRRPAVPGGEAVRADRPRSAARHPAIRTAGLREDVAREGNRDGERHDLLQRQHRRRVVEVGRGERADHQGDLPPGPREEAEHRLLRRDRGPVHGPRDDGHLGRAQEHHRADPERDGRPRRAPRRVRDRRDEPRGPRRPCAVAARAIRRDHRDPAARPECGGGDPPHLPERIAPGTGEIRGAIRRPQGGRRHPAADGPRRTVRGEEVGQGQTPRGSERGD